MKSSPQFPDSEILPRNAFSSINVLPLSGANPLAAEINSVLPKYGTQSLDQIAEGNTAAELNRAELRYQTSIAGIQPSVNSVLPTVYNGLTLTLKRRLAWEF
jgi:hypothetical protein